MDVSIVIVSFNTADYTLGCLKSVEEQTREREYEIIVVDNASSDGSPEQIAAAFPRAQVVRNGKNVGLAAAATQGLKMASGRYVIAMNSDVYILDGAIDKLIRFMDENPKVGGATPKLLLKDMSPHSPPFGRIPTPWTAILEVLSDFFGKMMTYSSRFKAEDVDIDGAQEVECIVWGTCFIVRREAMDQVGYQDPQFFIYCEDVDWSMRLKKAGWRLWYVPQAKIIHYGGQSADGESPRMVSLRMQSSIKLIQKHYGMWAGLLLRGALAFSGLFGYVKWMVLSSLPKAEWRDKGPSRKSRSAALLSAAVPGRARELG